MKLFSSKSTHSKLALCFATLTLVTACNQKPKTDTTNPNTATSTTATTSATTTTTTITVTESAAGTTPEPNTGTTAGTVSGVAPTPTAETAIVPGSATTTSSAAPTPATATKSPVTIPPEKAGLAKDLVAFNNALNGTAMKSQKLQADFIQKHKNDKSPDVQVLFIKEGIKSLDQQKSDLQAVKLTDPKVIAMRDKFISTIDQQKSAYTFMVNTPKPTQAQQDDVAKKMANVQKTGEDAQQTFLKLAQESGLQPAGTPQAGKQ